MKIRQLLLTVLVLGVISPAQAWHGFSSQNHFGSLSSPQFLIQHFGGSNFGFSSSNFPPQFAPIRINRVGVKRFNRHRIPFRISQLPPQHHGAGGQYPGTPQHGRPGPSADVSEPGSIALIAFGLVGLVAGRKLSGNQS